MQKNFNVEKYIGTGMWNSVEHLYEEREEMALHTLWAC